MKANHVERLPFGGSNSLTDLAARIRTYHEATVAALKSGVEFAMNAGDLLIEAKRQLKKHGEWLPWLETCGLPERTSQRYMRLARNRNIIEANPVPVSDFGIRGALALLAVPRKSGDDVLDPMADLADLSGELAFDFWDALSANKRSNEQTELRKALHAEARAAVERIGALATTPELAEAIEDASGDFCERLLAACTEYRAAVAGEMGMGESELDDLDADIARCKARGRDAGSVWGKWRHILDRDPHLPEGAATSVVSRVRDIATEWARHIETIIASAPPSIEAAP